MVNFLSPDFGTTTAQLVPGLRSPVQYLITWSKTSVSLYCFEQLHCYYVKKKKPAVWRGEVVQQQSQCCTWQNRTTAGFCLTQQPCVLTILLYSVGINQPVLFFVALWGLKQGTEAFYCKCSGSPRILFKTHLLAANYNPLCQCL